jgi:hypothetical protein
LTGKDCGASFDRKLRDNRAGVGAAEQLAD